MRLKLVVFLFGFLCAMAFADHSADEKKGPSEGGPRAPEAQKKASIDCELPKNPPPLKIVSLDGRIADNHKFVKGLVDRMVKGEIALSVDDPRRRRADALLKDLLAGRDGSKAKLFVHDDGLIEGLYRAASAYPQGLIPDPKEVALEDLRTSDYWLEAWDALKKQRPLKSAPAEALAVRLDALANVRLNPREWAEKMKTVGKEKDEVWNEVISAWATQYGRTVEAKYRGPRGLPEMKTFFDAMANPKDLDKQNAFMKAFVEETAIPKTATKVAEAYCEAVKGGAREVWVLTNPTYMHELRTAAQAMAAARRIPFRFRQFGSEFEIRDGVETDVTPFGEPPKP